MYECIRILEPASRKFGETVVKFCHNGRIDNFLNFSTISSHYQPLFDRRPVFVDNQCAECMA